MSTTTSKFYQGRIVATPIPDSWTGISSNTSSRQLPPNNKASQQQIDPEVVKERCGPLQYQPESHSELHKRGTHENQNVAISPTKGTIEESPCSATKLDIYIYDKSTSSIPRTSTHLELNRKSNELVSDTLQRVVLNLTKKLQRKGSKKQEKQRKQSASHVDSPAPSVWLVEADHLSPPSTAPRILEERDVSKLTNAELWKQAQLTPFAVTVYLPSNDESPATPLRFLVDSCPPTIMSVRTFEDFQACFFVGVPVVVQVDTLYATHCRVDWYVGGVKRQTTLETCSHIFVPEEADLDKEVTLLITPYRVGHDKDLLHYSHNGNGCEQAYRFQKRVEPLPENTLLRIRSRWLEETARTPERQANDAQSLRVLTYNILANQNVFQSNQMPFYPYVPQEILSKDRRMPLIVQEILSYRADVICLQEVDESVFYRLMEPLLTARQFNYQGYYTGKSSEGTREGCALFWSLDKFLPVPEEDLKSFAIQDLLIRDYGSDDLGWAESMRDLKALLERRPDLHRVFTTNLGQVVQMVPLTIRPRVKSAAASCSDARPIWIANTHLFFHPQASHIRLLQMFLLARQLGYELQQKPGDTVLCGDFNSSLQNAAGKLMLDRSVPANFRNNKTHLNTYRWDSSPSHDHQNAPNDDFPAVSLPDSFPLLHSAVDPAPAFTHFVDGFQGTLDHILVSKRLRCSQSAPMPSVKDVTVATAMPSANLPSDHVTLVCDLTTIDGS